MIRKKEKKERMMTSVVPALTDPLLEFCARLWRVLNKKKIPLPTHKIVPRLLVNRVRMVENKTINKENRTKED